MIKTIGLNLLYCLLVGTATVSAATIDLFDWAFNIDGSVYESYDYDNNSFNDLSIVPGLDSTGFNASTGLGILTWSTNIAGDHSFISFFNHDIDSGTNTSFNEYGAGEATASGQSWEIDEPGYQFGDIYDNVLDGSLDNTNNLPLGNKDDVSMALGWDFSLDGDETATITIILDTAIPDSGSYLQQTDPDSEASIYFSSSLKITSDSPAPVPEPSTFLLFSAGMIIISGITRKRIKK